MKKQLAVILASLVLSISVSNANAAMVSTTSLLQSGHSVAQHDSLETMRSNVADALVNFGVSAQEADLRVSLLTKDQLANLNGQLADMPAGGDIVGLVVFVFLVFIITDAIGATDVFTFVDPV